MERVRFVEHKGRRVLSVDFSNLRPEEAFPVLAEARATIAAQPPASLLMLTDVRQTYQNSEVTDAFRDYAAHNKPYVKASALVGVTGVKVVVLNAIKLLTRRNFMLFDTPEAALDWLATQ